LLSTLVTRYDVRIAKRPTAQLPVNLERAFVDIGDGECIDSFFAFGLFAVARQPGFFPKPLLDVVEPILRDLLRPRFVPLLAGLALRSLRIVSRHAKKPCATMS
jgi:hypothetical protein